MNVIKSIYMLFTIIVCAVLLALFYGNDTTQAQPLPKETSTGNIPTYVGKTMMLRSAKPTRMELELEHPHVCGEDCILQ